jgi:AcrR family transcriptional regulator
MLRALDELLRDGSLESINIAEITTRAGVSRSAFYFYFENKGAAVAAMMAEMYDKAFEASTSLYDLDATPRERIEGNIRGIFAALDVHQHLYRAMLEARQSNSSVRELWDADRISFIEPVAAMITAEREAGRAPAGPDSAALATVLLELNDHALEKVALGDELPLETRVDVLVTIWLRTIYGDTP